MAKKPMEVFPDLQEIETEMSQVRSKGRFRQALKGTAGTVIVVAALAVLVATIMLPVLRVTGTSMQPGFQPGDIIACYKTQEFKQGDICAFYFNNKLIIKRVIAIGGDLVEIDEEGHVSVNKVQLEESDYISEYALGMCDIEFPFQVPLNSYFVMGDNRDNSVDSRATNFGCIKGEEMVGKILVRIYPFNSLTYFGM
ncbi:MAG: signal peptidase I [Clostridia bacterium]|nr:signal peptidase I [Clostridia bacterium]